MFLEENVTADGLAVFESTARSAKVTVQTIQERVTSYFGISMRDLLSPSRIQSLARVRQISMWLARQLTTRSLPDIGRRTGGRDHTTVLHAIRRINELRDIDSVLRTDTDFLLMEIGGVQSPSTQKDSRTD